MAIREVSISDKKFEISYEILNPKVQKEILFLHGWGANKETMKQAFSPYLNNFRHIYLDLPGFGKSSNEYVLNTNDYAVIVKNFLNDLSLKPLVVVGHSFGGKIATLLAPKLLVLLSSAGIPKQKSLKTKLKIAAAKLFKPILGDSFANFFRTKDAWGLPKNMYETLKNVVDEDFSEIFSKIESKTLIFWGRDDDATPLYCGLKLASLIKNSTFYELDGNHYFFLFHAKQISEIIDQEC